MIEIAILGSTGSVGTQTLKVVEANQNKLRVIALTTNTNFDLLNQQIKKYKPKYVGIANEKLVKKIESNEAQVFAGNSANIEIARTANYDILLNSLVSLVGIEPTIEALKRGKFVALANKETLVAAGHLVMETARKSGAQILPVDSEHSALFQCLNGEEKKNIHRILLTCSGGALRDKSIEELKNVTVKDALGHKTWQMGQKITIDSATLMNKGFEVLEAMWLYDVPPEKIDVVIHPQSIIHSMIEYSDGSIMAQMAEREMTLPIQYALSYPERWDPPLKRLQFNQDLTFDKPDLERFPCLGYAYTAAKTKGTLPAVMNAANDFMVNKFLAGEKATFPKVAYLDIQKVVKKVMNEHDVIENPDLEKIHGAIEWARNQCRVINDK
jgi:1-deoxy-D-xylulose-5-phosphate reductoisomerase